jgi:hypothetical protein
MHRRIAAAVALLALAACGPARTAPPPPAPVEVEAAPLLVPPPPPPLAAGSSVWTRDPGAVLLVDTSGTTLPYLFMRLEVLEVDSARLRVRCVPCADGAEGWIARSAVIHLAPAPYDAVHLELADFALAVRQAAVERDIRSLRRVMSREFSHQLSPLEPGLLETFAAWEAENFHALDRLPFLLDRGIAAVPATTIWAAPPEFATTPAYADLRAGFRRGPDGWEWIFLVRDGR